MAIEQDCPRPAVLLIGRGWDFDGGPAFYPDDLPVEWRLAYYANEFKGVLAPEPAWLTVEAVWDWAGEVQEGFLFYLELSHLDQVRESRLRAVAKALGSAFGGLLYLGDPKGIEVELQSLSRDFPLWLLGNVVPSDLGIRGCATDMAVMGDGAMTAFYIEGDSKRDLKELRRLVETLERRGNAASPALLILGGDPPDILLLDQCRILLNLMGVA